MAFIYRKRTNRAYGGTNESQSLKQQGVGQKKNQSDRSSCRKLLTSLSEEDSDDRGCTSESPWQLRDRATQPPHKTFKAVYTSNGQCVSIVSNCHNNKDKWHAGTIV